MIRVLDSNICVSFLNGTDAAVRDRLLMLTPNEVFLCSVVKAELLYGARKSARVSENLARLAQFFGAMESLPFDDLAAEHYGTVRAQLESLGTPIGANDMLIAATCLSAGAVLVTRNQREFLRVTGLAVELW